MEDGHGWVVDIDQVMIQRIHHITIMQYVDTTLGAEVGEALVEPGAPDDGVNHHSLITAGEHN